MKCECAQKKILLAQSGELSGFGRFRVSGHLKTCPHCRQFQEELAGITTLTRSAEFDSTVSQETLERIRKQAHREHSRSVEIRLLPSRERFGVLFRPALVYSTISVLAIAGFIYLARPHQTAVQMASRSQTPATSIANAWDDNVDSAITQLDAMAVSAGGEWGAADRTTDQGGEEDAETLARELLNLEGQQI